MINEFPEREGHLEADLEQEDMFYGDDPGDRDPIESYKQWRRRVRAKGFRYVNMLSNKDTRVITVIFCRCPVSKLAIEEEPHDEKALCAVH